MTRRAFGEAIAKRLVGERYGRMESQHSHMSDMAIFIVPRLRSGNYLNLIRDSDVGKTGIFTKTADLMKEIIWRRVTDLVERVIVAKRGRDGGMNIDDSSKQQNQPEAPSGSGQTITRISRRRGRRRSILCTRGRFDDLDEGKDDISTRERTRERKRKMPSPSTKQ